MRKKETYRGAYKDLLAQFESNLLTLNYAKTTVKSDVLNVRRYLEYLQENGIDLRKTSTQQVKQYFDFLLTRQGITTGVGLSTSYLQKIKTALKSFYSFLSLTQKRNYSQPVFPTIKSAEYIPQVLTKEEIQKLFKACDETLLGKRNRALLALYYGLGLRRKEGVRLNTEDIDVNKGLVFIVKSKTYQQRLVPMSTNIQAIVEDYLYNVREKLIDLKDSEQAFLVTSRGSRLSSGSVDYVLRKLLLDAKIKTKASPHTLRHSIATHLLQTGMKLESISLFLGHKSLDSTQIYTHLSKS